MINSFRRYNTETQSGAVTLMMSIILLTAVTLIIIFAASFGVVQQKITTNQYRMNDALSAAEAGMEFGIQYLKQNSATVLASPVSGYISPYSDVNTTNVTLANNSKFTVVYTNPVANNYNLIQITSTGTSADGTATRTVSQQVQFGSYILNTPNVELIGKSTVSLDGNARITNTTTNQTIQAGGGVTLHGSSSTVTSSGGSSGGSIGSDITQNINSISTQSTSDFFATYFGVPSSTIKGAANYYYNNSSNTNYSTQLNGVSGSIVWIDQTGGTATINGSTTIGSPASPVLMIVNGSLTMSGNVTFYGLIFVSSTTGITTSTGSSSVVGAIITSDAFAMAGSSNLTYDSTTLTNLRSSSSTSYYAKVPGSWRDF